MKKGRMIRFRTGMATYRLHDSAVTPVSLREGPGLLTSWAFVGLKETCPFGPISSAFPSCSGCPV